MTIYTRGGDDGTTSLQGGKRLPKCHDRIEACGTIEELISWTGLLRSLKENEKRRDFLIYIQNQLMFCILALTSNYEDRATGIILPASDCIKNIEDAIDKIENSVRPVKSFIIPGGNPVVSCCDIARCVCRRAERTVVKLNKTEPVPEIIIIFLNRLSDYFFMLGRLLNSELGNNEIIWEERKL
ncbi:MAG TPA: cob(I)yrinic acid a,c-diamide adenosyltransferase [Bacteroidales bacterium]|nr:cob(I)yrinic acid a,c-diamide adenosyltransferase [Bacteroidales bacterium]HOU96116.1 cob(I)yrinic acid a,c-diamide adenosyltransferase [Bacteroidales bacterium]HQG36801.1 cob(I)yrinic acid a,c-diamide adenosyltransferase [Bacteroidales bacterium]HQG53583.1 cob(I)yrinic acid a,c-diamide adenosyltransferase [Bacteroidales bacterium]HQJ19728.1 cob(I)yrinic acid a,c-diamide adenosyltransferase [Bacteroidales bacterium]